MRAARGFVVGDVVRVTDGEHAGRSGRVVEIKSGGHYCIEVLNRDSTGFAYVQVRGQANLANVIGMRGEHSPTSGDTPVLSHHIKDTVQAAHDDAEATGRILDLVSPTGSIRSISPIVSPTPVVMRVQGPAAGENLPKEQSQHQIDEVFAEMRESVNTEQPEKPIEHMITFLATKFDIDLATLSLKPAAVTAFAEPRQRLPPFPRFRAGRGSSHSLRARNHVEQLKELDAQLAALKEALREAKARKEHTEKLAADFQEFRNETFEAIAQAQKRSDRLHQEMTEQVEEQMKRLTSAGRTHTYPGLQFYDWNKFDQRH